MCDVGKKGRREEGEKGRRGGEKRQEKRKGK